MVEVKQCNFDELSEEQVNRLFDLLIHAYAVTEVEIWGANYFRMNKEEYVSLLKGNNVLVAWLANEIVGSIYYYNIRDHVFGFGLLNADFSKSGRGIGRALIKAAEKRAKHDGATEMQLEILRAKDIHVPVKEQLSKWYIAQGYNITGTYSFLELKPDKVEKAKQMVNPSVFDVYNKTL